MKTTTTAAEHSQKSKREKKGMKRIKDDEKEISGEQTTKNMRTQQEDSFG